MTEVNFKKRAAISLIVGLSLAIVPATVAMAGPLPPPPPPAPTIVVQPPAPAPTPGKLVETGPASTLAVFAGVSTFAGVFHYLWRGNKSDHGL